VVSVDIYRPAAREQLAIIARDIKIPIYPGTPEETAPSIWPAPRAAKPPTTAAMCCWSIPPAACTSTIS
jgi:hypothetical protein